jgi:hypothetical protein
MERGTERAKRIANFDAWKVRQEDEDLALETGPVHDYFWHCRNRARRSGQLVEVAILVTLAAMVSWVLVLHH